MVALATIIDTCFGVWKAVKLGEDVTSKIFRKGLLSKLLTYVAATMLIFASDVFIIISTKILSLVLVAIEVKSMDESFIKVNGYSFIDRAKSIIVKIKNIKGQL
jgi:hypothetical protein